jgi:hypothetical protein
MNTGTDAVDAILALSRLNPVKVEDLKAKLQHGTDLESSEHEVSVASQRVSFFDISCYLVYRSHSCLATSCSF